MSGGQQLTVPTLESIDPGIEHGEVFTRRWVAELVLDLAGYRVGNDLGAKAIVEPSCGRGAFLVPIVERLLADVGPTGITECGGLIHAFDLLEANTDVARKAVTTTLVEGAVDGASAEALARQWVTTGDFLLDDLGLEQGTIDLVVGNPPYVRLESVDQGRMDAYRNAHATMRGRSDLYVGFYEHGLRLLAEGGRVAFICADRWMHNQYGAALRQLIADNYAVRTIVSMHDVEAFHHEVSAYPAITVLERAEQGEVVVVDTTSSFTAPHAPHVVGQVDGDAPSSNGAYRAARLPAWTADGSLWPAGDPDGIAIVRDIEKRFGPLEDDTTGTRVGIGVATGADDVYLTRDTSLVEDDRLLPLVTSRDIASGAVEWSGTYLVNPWTADGLVDLHDHPQLADYYQRHGTRLRGRHVAQRRPDVWYRTIDRVNADLRERPKLLLPDMKAAAHPVLDDGGFYPHHNLYHVTSDVWDMEVLGGLLLSDVTNLFISTYCVKMRGGTYRFQAQYLRMIRLPRPAELDAGAEEGLRSAFRARDREVASAVACEVFGVDLDRVRRVLSPSHG